MTDDLKNTELLACPVCGATPKIVDRGAVGVRCHGPDHLIWAYGATAALAVKRWNRRSPAPAPAGLREAVEAAGMNATLPDGYRWGSDAMEAFSFGKRRAVEAILSALPAAGEGNGA